MKLAMNLESPRLTLNADTAAEIMTTNPISLNQKATLKEAIVLFTAKSFGAAPVIDDAGRPVGTLSGSDILVHSLARVGHQMAAVGPATAATLKEAVTRHGPVDENKITVSELMTPGVFSVSLDTKASSVISDLLRLRVHHLFVVDEAGTLVGVISPLDVLRKLVVPT